MNIIDLIFEDLKNLGIKNIGLIKEDGTFLETTFNKSAQNIISKIVYNNRDIPVNNYIKQKLVRDSQFLYIYKVSYNGFLICVSSLNTEIVIKKFGKITTKYGFQLFKLFKSENIESATQNIPKLSVKNIESVTQNIPKLSITKPISVIIISKNKDFMSDPVAWIPNEISEIEAIKISNKALLLILGDTEEIRECYSLIHFIKRNQLGLIYLFEYPNLLGPASATLTILFDENAKKAILSSINEIETEIKSFLDENRKIFNFNNEKLKELNDLIITTLNKPKIEKRHEGQVGNRDSDLKEAMIRAIKRLGMSKNVEKQANKSSLKAEMVKTIKEVKDKV